MKSTVSNKILLSLRNEARFKISSYWQNPKHLITFSGREGVLARLSIKYYIIVRGWTSSRQFGVLKKKFLKSVTETGNVLFPCTLDLVQVLKKKKQQKKNRMRKVFELSVKQEGYMYETLSLFFSLQMANSWNGIGKTVQKAR